MKAPKKIRVFNFTDLIYKTECPFCEQTLKVADYIDEIVCSCCDRPMDACPDRFTACESCGGASVDTCHCDLCGAKL